MSKISYAPAPKNLIFSGIQPTGALTIGNYLGAIRNWVNLQDDYDCIYCLVDQHALTIEQDDTSLKDKCRAGAAAVLACGIDAKKHILMVQSHNPDHAELAWYFTCTARMGWLNRMTQFKDKAGKNRERASTGLFIYPNLMSADIMAYRASHVPVGDDQKQHLELARDIAMKFNHDWGVEDFFPLIEPIIMPEASRIMSLRDGTKKMAKSDPSDQSRINLSDNADVIAQKIRKAKTDPHPLPDNKDELDDRPEALNLLTIYAALEQRKLDDIINEFSGASFSDFKRRLADLTVSYFAPITSDYNHYMADPDELDRILKAGGERARQISNPILVKTREIMGLMPS